MLVFSRNDGDAVFCHRKGRTAVLTFHCNMDTVSIRNERGRCVACFRSDNDWKTVRILGATVTIVMVAMHPFGQCRVGWNAPADLRIERDDYVSRR